MRGQTPRGCEALMSGREGVTGMFLCQRGDRKGPRENIALESWPCWGRARRYRSRKWHWWGEARTMPGSDRRRRMCGNRRSEQGFVCGRGERQSGAAGVSGS
ncbi:hypothetical protein TRVL_06803 [Trypanosoma vivax]|nr:hypothetical protein TRVL_06803 [Trypanosoma vivax]